MRIPIRLWIVLSAVCLVAATLGCQQGVTDQGPGEKEGGKPVAAESTDATASIDAAQVASEVGTAGATTAAAPTPLTIPEVRLTDAQRATCVVQVGDTMPEGELPGLDGRNHVLRKLYGPKATLLCFWSGGDSPYAKMLASTLLEDLGKDIVPSYGKKGVQAIAINEGDSPEAAGRSAPAGVVAVLPILLDSDGAYFAKVATDKPPRIYLLDAGGKILWFDLEYSETTRQQLQQAIQVVLGEK